MLYVLFVLTIFIVYPENVVGDNELASVEIFTLHVECPEPVNANDFESSIKQYAQDIVNLRDPVAVFYKANINRRISGLNNRYTFHFFLYYGAFFTDAIRDEVTNTLQQQLSKKGVQDIQTTYVVNQLLCDITPEPLANQDQREEKQQGNDMIPGNCFQRFLHWWLIVPSVQWKFFGLLCTHLISSIMDFSLNLLTFLPFQPMLCCPCYFCHNFRSLE